MDLAFYNGKLYAGVQTEHFPTVGGSVGEVWRYDGNKLWTRVKTGLGNSAVALEVYKDETGAPALFVATNTMAIKYCSVCDGTPADWVDVAQGSGTGFRSGYVTSAALCGEPELFLGELNTDDFWRFTWNTGLVEIDTQSGSCIWDFAEYDSDYDTGHLYAGAWAGNGGPVYRTEPDFLCDQLRSSLPRVDFTVNYAQNNNNRGVNVWALETFGGTAIPKAKLYAGGGVDRNGARLWSFDGHEWSLVFAHPDSTTNNEGVSALVAHQGRLFVGLGLPDGYYAGDGIAEVWVSTDGILFEIASLPDQFGGGVQCFLSAGTSGDCNGNGVPDECDIANSTSEDCNGNGIPDECEMDCNNNNVPDDCDVDPSDPDGNGLVSPDCNINGISDECEPDCQPNGVADDCDIANGTSHDWNYDGIPDECQILGAAIYVDENALLSPHDGSDWDHAYLTLQEGLADARANPEKVFIFVADGVYEPDDGTGQPGNRSLSFDLVNGFAMVGGFAGSGAADPFERQPQALEPLGHASVLSGDLLKNDQPGFVNNADNSYHVVTAGSTVTGSIILDGFFIVGGNADGYEGGGGLSFRGGTSHEVSKSCRIVGHRRSDHPGRSLGSGDAQGSSAGARTDHGGSQ